MVVSSRFSVAELSAILCCMSPPGGEADDTVINTGGIEELPVNDGGAIGTTVNNGGILEVFNIVPGAGGTIVNSGGYELVNGGQAFILATAQWGTVVNAGGAELIWNKGLCYRRLGVVWRP
jgi:hypothetical protein